MRKKILFIWHAGVVKSYQKYIEELAEYDDLDITLLIPKEWTEGSKRVKAYIPQSAKFKVVTAHILGPKDPLIAIYPYLPYYLWKIKPDLIHLFEEPWHNLAAYLFFWKKLICPGAKLIFQTFQNQIEEYQKSWIRIQANTFNESTAAISCTTEGKAVLLHWGYQKPIYVIYPGVETDAFKPANADKIKEKFGLKYFTIGYFGRMIKEKGLEDLIAATNKLDFPHQLLFVGDGKDKEYLKTLTKKALWIEAVDPETINQYYSALNAFVLPSRTTPKWKEQFGRVLVEAMLCGVPVIGSSSGEIPNVIGNAGLVFKEGNPEDLSEKIIGLRKDLNFRRSLIEKGLIRARKFDWKQTAAQVYKVYQEVLR